LTFHPNSTIIPIMWNGFDDPIDLTAECDCCHDIFPQRELEFNGKQFLCLKCKTEKKNEVNDLSINS